MLATPHMCAGAALGAILRRPWLTWPAAFASHFLLDYNIVWDSPYDFLLWQWSDMAPKYIAVSQSVYRPI